GHVDEAEQILDALDATALAPAHQAIRELAAAGIAMRRIRARMARAALTRAAQAATRAGIPALVAEVDHAFRVLDTPAARLIAGGRQQPVLLEEVETILASTALIVDACRYVVQAEHTQVRLAGRPLLLTLAQALAEAWPDDVPREAL